MEDLGHSSASPPESQGGHPRVKFHPVPMPERIQQVSFLPTTNPLWQLSVGVVTQTISPSGLKILPTREVTFEIANLADEAHWTAFGVDPSSARVIAARLNEFADACEGDWVTAPDPNLPKGA
jgi:hypothetical protein